MTKPTSRQLKSIKAYIHSHRCQFAAWGVTDRFKVSYLDALYHVLSAALLSEKLDLPSAFNWQGSITLLQLDRWQQVGAMPLPLSRPKEDPITAAWAESDAEGGLVYPDEWPSDEDGLPSYREMLTP